MRFLGIVSLIFSKFWRDARIPCEVMRDRAGFSGKIFLPSELGEWTQSGSKTGYFKFIG